MATDTPLPEHIEALMQERQRLAERISEIDESLSEWMADVAAAVECVTGQCLRETSQYQAVVTYVRAQSGVVGAQEVAAATGQHVSTVRVHLSRAATENALRRVARGQYAGGDTDGN